MLAVQGPPAGGEPRERFEDRGRAETKVRGAQGFLSVTSLDRLPGIEPRTDR